MGNEIGLGDHIAFRSPDISSFEIVAVITKLLNGGSFLCYSTTPPLSGLGEFALLPSDLGEIEVICQGEDAVRN
ncbi:MAG: hypothetical protein NTV39_04625, partial [Candidatus Saccharibacteria bacterium]|nr:hypothetical protein [Candidatus Saccharibacteria bacterium]